MKSHLKELKAYKNIDLIIEKLKTIKTDSESKDKEIQEMNTILEKENEIKNNEEIQQKIENIMKIGNKLLNKLEKIEKNFKEFVLFLNECEKQMNSLNESNCSFGTTIEEINLNFSEYDKQIKSSVNELNKRGYYLSKELGFELIVLKIGEINIKLTENTEKTLKRKQELINELILNELKTIQTFIENWIQTKEIELNSQKEIKNNMSLEEIEIEIKAQKVFQTENQNKSEELMNSFDDKVNQLIDCPEMSEESENLKNIFKILTEKSEQRVQKLKEIKEIIEFKGNIIEKYKNEFKKEYEIGFGSFGRVYRVMHNSNKKVYAIQKDFRFDFISLLF